MTRPATILVPSPWSRPNVVELVPPDTLTWSRERADPPPAEEIRDGEDLAGLLDAFVALGRPDERRGGYARRIRKVRDFSKSWGPWADCSCRGIHGPLGALSQPPSRPPWSPRRRTASQPAVMTLWAAEAVNALRTLLAVRRAGEEPPADAWPHLVTADTLTWQLDEGAVRRELRRLYRHNDPHGILDTWVAAVHAVPSAVPDDFRALVLNVGGVAGAVIVALLAEVYEASDLGARTATCTRCKVTWRVRRSWDDSMLLGDLCSACKSADRQPAARQERPPGRGRKEAGSG